MARAHNPPSPSLPPSPRLQEGLDEYGIIRVINFVRGEVVAGRDPLPALAAAAAAGKAAAAGAAGKTAAAGGDVSPWADDRYLVPVLEDDALLCYDFEEVAAAAAAAAAERAG